MYEHMRMCQRYGCRGPCRVQLQLETKIDEAWEALMVHIRGYIDIFCLGPLFNDFHSYWEVESGIEDVASSSA